MEDEFNKSERRARELDSDDRSITDKGSDNRASAELIGSHSLMAKDSSDKERFSAGFPRSYTSSRN